MLNAHSHEEIEHEQHHHHEKKEHDHNHEKPSTPNDDLLTSADALFPAHLLESKDLNVRVIIYLCRLTKLHKFVTAFDKVLKPLPQLGQALASTLFISIVPIFFIYGANNMLMSNKAQMENVTLYLISFAIGGLLGDVFFHTLPHM
jgi:hypothetical protein